MSLSHDEVGTRKNRVPLPHVAEVVGRQICDSGTRVLLMFCVCWLCVGACVSLISRSSLQLSEFKFAAPHLDEKGPTLHYFLPR